MSFPQRHNLQQASFSSFSASVFFFWIPPLLGFTCRFPPPTHSQRCPLPVHISCACFLGCAEKGRGKRGAAALFHSGVSTLLPSGIEIAQQIAFRAFNKSEYTFLTVFHCPDRIYPQEKREGRIKNQRHGKDSHTEPAVPWIICLGGKEWKLMKIELLALQRQPSLKFTLKET